ncbi:MAG TPA: hypothetical protein PLU53_08275 [Bacteroidia bacterium]|nr:hypothetical protein [Bacteroidia bacterium]
MKSGQTFSLLLLLTTASVSFSCLNDKEKTDVNGYPEDIAKIVLTNCANAGCHNDLSYMNCAGLNLSTWEKCLEGGKLNAVVIPYRPDQSTFFHSVNTDSTLGPVLIPTMPLNLTSLSRTQILEIQNWIQNGAPNENGIIAFSGDPFRKKIYVINQGCDLISVFDKKSKLLMRCIDVGNQTGIESPHDLFVAPDNQHWYLSFYSNSIVQKYDAVNDVLVGQLNLGEISWHSMAVSNDSRYGLAVHWADDGIVALLDLNTMTVLSQNTGFSYPHGCTLNADGSVGYVTAEQGNFLTRFDFSNPLLPDESKVVLNPGTQAMNYGIYKPYEVDFCPDFSKYAVTCQGTHEVRVFDAATDTLLVAIPTSGVPQLMGFSADNTLLFVTNMEDSANAGTMSAIDVIDLRNLVKIKSIISGYQPRGLAVDDEQGLVWIANRNISPVGWTPHHSSACAGRNGYITLLDMHSLELVPNWKSEIAVDPYCVGIRK